MNFRIVFVLIAALVTLCSHEFWLHPNKFIYKTGETINLRLHVGENYDGENWRGDATRIESFRLFFADVHDDLSEQIEERGDSLQLQMHEEGTVMMVYRSNNAFIELDSTKFNEYLQEDDLQSAIRYRQEHHETGKPGRELYQRNAKTLIQVGKLFSNVYNLPTGLPLDIVPLTNPYTLANKDSLRVKILFRGQPFSNALVKVWQREKKHTNQTHYVTNRQGELSFPVQTKGRWMVSTVNMVRLESDSADWQSYWGSLTWGYVK